MNWIALRKQFSSCYLHGMFISTCIAEPGSMGEIDRRAVQDWGWALTMGGEMNR